MTRRNHFADDEEAASMETQFHTEVLSHLRKYDTQAPIEMPLLQQAVAIIHAAHRELEELQRTVPTLDRAAAAMEARDYDTANNLLASIDESFLLLSGLNAKDFDPDAPDDNEYL